MKLDTKQHKIPKIRGKRKETTVHFMLPVSFLIIKNAGKQGQCIRVNIINDTAVDTIQPCDIKMPSMAEAERSVIMLEFV